MAREQSRARDSASAELIMQPTLQQVVAVGGVFGFECYGGGVFGKFFRGRRLKWQDEAHNLVTNVGLTYVAGVALLSVTQITTWYVGLMDGTPTVAAADTMSSHAGWTELDEYAESVRQTWTGVAGAAGAATNSAAKAAFTIASSQTCGGAFLVSNNTKAGTTGTLLCGAALSGGNRAVVNNDVVRITYGWTTTDN